MIYDSNLVEHFSHTGNMWCFITFVRAVVPLGVQQFGNTDTAEFQMILQ